MTVRAATQADGGTPTPEPVHPLQRLSADEIRLARTVLAEQGLVGEHTRLTYLGLEEPPKSEVLGFRPGDPVDRRVRAILLDAASGAATDVVASLTRNAVVMFFILSAIPDEPRTTASDGTGNHEDPIACCPW